MTDSETFAWILLSVPERGGRLQDLIAMADGITPFRRIAGFVIAPDGSRAGLAGSVGDFATREICPSDETRWASYEIACNRRGGRLMFDALAANNETRKWIRAYTEK